MGGGAAYAAMPEEAEAGFVINPATKKLWLEAYHGSPHDFDKFQMSQIGTGEGAQAYGHGMYFADEKKVAEEYRRMFERGDEFYGGKNFWNPNMPGEVLAGKIDVEDFIADQVDLKEINALYEKFPDLTDDEIGMVHDHVSKEVSDGYSPYKDEDFNPELLAIYRNAAKDLKPIEGSLYKTNIDVQPDELLDWDKPLSEQSQHVQDAFLDLGLEDFMTGEKMSVADIDAKGWRGEQLYDKAMYQAAKTDEMGRRATSPEAAVESLRSKGIKGIQYKDGMSRGSEGGTNNYVIFDEDLISIAEKNGIPFQAVENIALNEGISKQAALSMLVGGGAVGGAMTPRPALAMDTLENPYDYLDAQIAADVARNREMQQQRIEAPKMPALAALTDFVGGITGMDYTPGGSYNRALEHAAWGTGDMGDVANEMAWAVADVEPTGALGAGMLAKELSQDPYDRLIMEADMYESFGDPKNAMMAREQAYQTRLQAPVDAAKQAGQFIGDVGGQFWEEYFE